jgi:hypothetical protein
MILAHRDLTACTAVLCVLYCSAGLSAGTLPGVPFSLDAFDFPPYIPGPDCNSNGVDDTLDISGGTSIDCDENGYPDECDWDLDGDGVPWLCDPCAGFPNIDSDNDRICDSMDMCPGHDSHCEAPDNVIFVWPAARGGKTGRNWYNAYRHIGAALFSFEPGKEIWVAAGTYYTDGSFQAPGGSRIPVTGGGSYFSAPYKMISVYGGFSGTETSRDQRDWRANVVTFRGENDRDGIPANYYGSIIYDEANCSSEEKGNTLFDGVTFSGGGRSGALWGYGGAVYSYCADYTFRNCTFDENRARYGGAVHANRSSMTFESCRFDGNEAVRGGGIYIRDGNLNVVNCAFVDNIVTEPIYEARGGGIYNESDYSVISRCTFTGNQSPSEAPDSGAAAFIAGESPIIRDCLIWGNGGSLRTYFGSALSIKSPALIERCRFLSNTDLGMMIEDSSPEIRNCEFVGNTGHGVRVVRGEPTFSNSTFARNSGSGVSVAFYEPTSPGHLTLSNCLVWGNSGSPQVGYDNSRIIVYDSLIEGGWTGIGHGNIDADPLFVDVDGPDDIIGTLDDDVRLLPGSPCIDAGSNGLVLPDFITDIEGNPRAAGCVVDIGAYEFGAAGLGDVDSDGLSDECDPDNDNDGVPNADDVCAATPTGQQVTPWGAPKGDINDDCTPTVADHEYFEICLWLSGPQQEPIFADCLGAFDFDGDDDVDLQDFASFARVIQ